jgi:N-acetylglucosaminyldiphosphoundecaprenol N-acetyl-beta-D-mannosaminyltransferase
MDRSAGSIQGAPTQVAFVNADCVNIAFRNAAYANTLRHCELVFADGVGMKIAGRVLGRSLCDNVNGTDMFPQLAAEMARQGRGVYLLGGRPGVPEGVAEWLATHHPDVRICGVRHGYFSPAEEPHIEQEIAASGADLLLVAFGDPRQTLWVAERLPRLGVPVAMGVGGLFDFFSGRIPRAPRWMRRLGIEWLYRLYREPRRLAGRYLIGNVVFLARLARVAWHRRKRPAF